MSQAIRHFVKNFAEELREDNAAVFIGAGLSVSSGFVNWRALLEPVADELGLDVQREHDLIALAQYHCNENAGGRHLLNQLIVNRLSEADPNENHRLLANLPITTYWTTNYDRLIEQSLSEAGKVADVKYTVDHLATTRIRRDAVVYKMHGDVEHPHEAVLTRDDYERFHLMRGAFTNALSGDLVSRTFLFLGFSFTDPNLAHVLSRIRITYRDNQRRHYCIFKRIADGDAETTDEVEYARKKQLLLINDLKRFNIRTLLIDRYQDVTDILSLLDQTHRRQTVFISGSSADYQPWGEARTKEFLRKLGKALVQEGNRVVSGIGLGVGNAVISGAVEAALESKASILEDWVIMRPFPQAVSDLERRDQLWEEYRQGMVARAGIAIVVMGNKSVDGNVIHAQGVRRECEIARKRGLVVIPIGSSGAVAADLWKEAVNSLDEWYPNSSADFRNLISSFGGAVAEPTALIPKLLTAIRLIQEQ